MKHDDIIAMAAMARSSASSIVRSFQPHTLRQKLRVTPWFQAHGDKTLRLEYDLTPDSTVFDLGGYEGNWASDIFAMYRCNLYVFEPVPVFHDFISNRFRKNPAIRSFQFGLGSRNQTLKITVADDASGAFTATRRGRGVVDKKVEVTIKRFSDFIKGEAINWIDLVKINIEGGEYDLMDHILATGTQHRLGNIQIQFHDFVPNAQRRAMEIQRQLMSSHHLTYQFPFVWENWERNP